MSTVITPNPAVNGPETAIATVARPTAVINSNLPDYMQGIAAEDYGLDLMKEYVRPPMLKIVQSMSPDALKDAFGEGAVIMSPSNICLLQKPSTSPTPLRLVPLFMWPEAIAWNPRGHNLPMFAMDKSNRPMRTTDVQSDLMRRARSMDKKLTEWQAEGAPVGEMVRLQEHLNFIVMVEGVPELEGIPVLLSFSRMQHKHGRSWINDIVTRRMPICSMYWHLNINPTKAKNAKGSWWDWQIKPETLESGLISVVPAEWFAYYAELAKQFKKDWQDGLIQPDYDEPADSVDTETAAASAPAPGKF